MRISEMTQKRHCSTGYKISLTICLTALLALSSCNPALPADNPATSSPEIVWTPTSSQILPSITTADVSLPPTVTRTPGPSPTSTTLPPLGSHTWVAKPIMIEAAQVGSNPQDPFQYAPFFVLYGDGLLITRVCQDGECRYQQGTLEQDVLCRLVNTIDRTGFLNVDSSTVRLPGGTGIEIRLAVHLFAENSFQISDLDRWIESPDWYAELMGCPHCFPPAEIDPAIIALYRILITYPTADTSGLVSERLAVWITKPVISGDSQEWHPDLVSLSQLADGSQCTDGRFQQQAVILEGTEARAVADFISRNNNQIPVFKEGDSIWQVQSRWLLPYEMPQGCHQPPGLYPPITGSGISWSCSPEMGAIPTSTATITPTPSITPTPLR